MRNNFLSLSAACMVLIAISCKPCDPCEDPKLVKVPADDSSAPTGQWSVSQAVIHNDGTMTSSISMVADASLPVPVVIGPNHTPTLHFSATDNESGVKCLTLNGSIGYQCAGEGQAISVHPAPLIAWRNICTPLTTCGMTNLDLQYPITYGMVSCNYPMVLIGGQILVNIITENTLGVKDTFPLTLTISPPSL